MNNDLISYLITDPLYYSNKKDTFEKKLQEVLNSKKVDFACFRDDESENFEELAKSFVDICKKNNIEKILINSDFELASKLGANGVHLKSTQFDKIKESKKLDLYTIISCHNYKDIEEALKYHVNAITYSPIFETPNKGEPKGLTKLRETVQVFEDLDIIALGGIIDDKQVDQIKKTDAFGFASIRYFI
jgi:thiamine-phosphate pyrophosphorylase